MKNVLSIVAVVLSFANLIMLCIAIGVVSKQSSDMAVINETLTSMQNAPKVECNFTKENFAAIQESIYDDQEKEQIEFAEKYVTLRDDYIERSDYSTYICGSVSTSYDKPVSVKITFWCYGKNNRFLDYCTAYVTIPAKENVSFDAYAPDDMVTYEIYEIIASEY